MAMTTLDHIFEKPLPENPTLLQSLSSWKHIKSIKPIDNSSFTEIFGELHFKERPIHHESSSSSTDFLNQSQLEFDITKNAMYSSNQRKQYRNNSDSFSSMNSERLSLCTEGLGFESSDDVEDDCNNNERMNRDERKNFTRHHESKRSRMSVGELPPPISCIGKSGKPWVYFKSYRQDGRFILKEIRIPTQEFLHPCREDGRLKLRFIHSESDDEIFEGDEDEERDEESVEENIEDDNGGSDNNKVEISNS